MKRTHSYILIVALLLCIIVVALALVSRTSAVTAANTLAVDITTQALSGWNAELIVDNASVTLLEQGGDDFYPTYFATLRRLGELQEITDINFVIDLPTVVLPATEGSATYTMNAVFSGGQAEIRIAMQRREGRWWFTEYLVLAPFMAS
ncbi:MAG: hypothetical protein KKD00_08620 [Gammaproteobacteria bacterium]|nr:hypothetical protein [Gammaproteobacteria bacterium]